MTLVSAHSVVSNMLGKVYKLVPLISIYTTERDLLSELQRRVLVSHDVLKIIDSRGRTELQIQLPGFLRHRVLSS